MGDEKQLILTKIKPRKYKKKIIDKNSSSDDLENNEFHKFLSTIQFVIDNYNDLKPDINDDIFTPSKLMDNDNLRISSTIEVPSNFPLISINKIRRVFGKNKNKVPNLGDVWNYCFEYSGERVIENPNKSSNSSSEINNKSINGNESNNINNNNSSEFIDDDNVPKSLVSLYEHQKFICSIYEMCLHIVRNMNKSKTGNANDPKYLASWLLESKVLQQECEKYNWVRMQAKLASMNDEVMSLTMSSSGSGKVREKQMSYLKKNDFGVQCHSTVGVKTSSINEKIMNDDEIMKNRTIENEGGVGNSNSIGVNADISKDVNKNDLSDIDDDFEKDVDKNDNHENDNTTKKRKNNNNNNSNEDHEVSTKKKKKIIDKRSKVSQKVLTGEKKDYSDEYNNNKDSPDDEKFDIEEAFKNIENSGKNNNKKKIKLNRSMQDDEPENMFDNGKNEDQDVDDDHEFDFF